MSNQEIHSLLESLYAQYNTPDFIVDDPISIPHRYSSKADIEIMGFFAATLAWGQRISIINNCKTLGMLMEESPYQFITQHDHQDLGRFEKFVHRTFNSSDLLYFIEVLQRHYLKHDSLESAFSRHLSPEDDHVGPALSGFHKWFFSLDDAPERTKKHVATPDRKSACKRLNMFLRWMVRKDERGVDFGLWSAIRPDQLICPCDIHVGRVARSLGLLHRKQNDWEAALELTRNLRQFDAQDPVKYDLALFSLGVAQKSAI